MKLSRFLLLLLILIKPGYLLNVCLVSQNVCEFGWEEKLHLHFGNL